MDAKHLEAMKLGRAKAASICTLLTPGKYGGYAQAENNFVQTCWAVRVWRGVVRLGLVRYGCYGWAWQG